MTEQTITAVQKALAPLAEKLGMASAVVWEAAIRQQLLVGVAYVFAAVLLAGLTLAFCRLFWRDAETCATYDEWNKTHNRNEEGAPPKSMVDYYSPRGSAMAWRTIGLVISGFWLLLLIPGMMRLLNPTWYAVWSIVSAVK
jgi:hypothetical protein